MASVITSSFHNSVAEDVLSEILANTSRYYYYFGNTTPAPATPEVPLNSPKYIAETRENMIILKQIAQNDVSFVLPRNDWVSGTRYNKYESAVEGKATNFYVMTDDFNVYKCLDNGYYNSLSITKPSGSDIEPIDLVDGYKWKFMYNVPLALRNKFMTVAYIPVATGLQNRFFSSGEIESVIILANGVGYTQGTTSIVVNGDGTGAVMTPVISGGQLVSVVINNSGIGYTDAIINVVSSIVTDPANKASVVGNLVNGNINTQQAIIEYLTTPGPIDSISIINGGAGFTSVPKVTVVGDGTGCTATAEVVNGAITRIRIVTSGLNYTRADVVLTDVINGADYALVANVSPPLGHGRNAVKEFFADTIMFYGNISGDLVSGFPVNNDFQQFGLIKNVRSSTFDLSIVDQIQLGKFTIYTNSSVNAFNIGDHIANVGLSQDFTVTAKEVGALVNALQLTPNGAYDPVIGATYTKVAGAATVVPVSLTYKTLLSDRVSTFCFVVEAVFDPMIYVNDVILTKGDKNFIIVAAKDGKLLVQSLNGGTISNGDNLMFGVNSISVMTSTPPTASKSTGDILTIDNRNSFIQSEEQAVSTRTVIKF
jgi:hypothetical protein